MPPGAAVSAVVALVCLVPDNAAPSALFTASVAIGLFVLLLTVSARSAVPNSVHLLTLLYFTTLVATLASSSFDALPGAVRMAALVVLLGWTAARFGPRDRLVFERTVIGLACGEAALAVLQRVTGGFQVWGWLGDPGRASVIDNPLWGGSGRATGTLGHAIPLATLLGLALVLALVSKAVSRWQPRLAVIGLLTAGLAATGSRSAVIVLAAVILYLVFVSRGTRRPVTETFAALAVLGCGLLIDVRSLEIFTSLSGSISLQHRTSSWDTLGALFTEQPLLNILVGNGWAGVAGITDRGLMRSELIGAIDNNVVTVVAVAGVVGLGFLIALMTRAYIHGDSATRASLLFLAGMFLSFDVLLWASAMSLVVVVSMASTAKATDHLESAREELRTVT